MSSIRKTKAGKFEARVWVNGKRHSRTFDSIAKAEHWSAGVVCGEIKVTSGHKTDADKQSGSAHVTVYEALERYLTEVVPTQKGAFQSTYRVRSLQCEPFAHKKLCDLSIDDVRRLRDRELERGCAGSTVTRKLAVLSSMLSHANQEWGLSTDNPVRKVRRPSQPTPRVRRLTVQDEAVLLDCCRKIRTANFAQAVELAIETAMRKSELLGLTWQAIDFDRQVITLHETKNGYARFVPLTERAAEILRASKESGAPIPVPISQSALDGAWKRVIRTSGLRGFRFHDLRHEGLSRWANRLSGDVFKLSLVSGHKTLSMAQRYVHATFVELMAKLV